MILDIAPPATTVLELILACCSGCAAHQFPITMAPKSEKIAATSPVGDCRSCAIGQGFEHVAQRMHRVECAQQIGMPKCEPVSKQECKFKWKVRPHDFKSKMGVEVDQD